MLSPLLQVPKMRLMSPLMFLEKVNVDPRFLATLLQKCTFDPPPFLSIFVLTFPLMFPVMFATAGFYSWALQLGPIAGPSWSHLGAILEPSERQFWSHLGSILGPSWSHLGAMSGPSGSHLGAIWEPSGSHLGAILEPSWSHLGAILEPSWSRLEPS